MVAAAHEHDFLHVVGRADDMIIVGGENVHPQSVTEVLEAMNADSGHALTELKVDGGMTRDELLMQFQADQVNVPVVRPVVAETTALGAAYAAGIAVGFWEGENDVTDNWAEDKRWEPKMDKNERERLFRNWKKAVTKTFDWVDDDVKE